METILFLGHTESDGSLPASALEALGAARTLAGATNGSTLVVGLVGGDVRAAADGIAGCGAARFLGVSGQDFRQSRYASDAAAVEALCKAAAATLVIAPGTSRWNRVLPGVARTLRPWIILLDPGCHGPWQGERGAAKLEAVAVDLSEGSMRTTVTGVQAPPADQQTIRPDAEVLFVAGAGWTKTQADGKTHASEAAELILGFLRKSQASLGGSKSLVDLKGEGQAVLPFMTHLNQVGQTGSTPRHPKGLSTCCHGEEPHVVGWRFVNERRAVNLDPNCGWARGKADVLYVADAFEVMRKVNALLGEK
ncbi:MAG: electron transfer flavoprotein subunit alpha [candidate division NC10 bacterium]|nr:electron transfer flavoprotein subunit alpha [candidate division NC10 bacterium]